jgi:glycosyltransferase involved in cell wall biosynthesis
MNKKILLVTNIPTPYRIPLFNQLDDQIRRLGLTFKVIFGARGYPRRLWKINMSECRFDHEILPSRLYGLGNKEKTMFSYRGLVNSIRKEKPAAVISSGFSIATMKVWMYSLFSAVPYFIWSGETQRKKSFSFLRDIQRRILIKRAKGFIAYGSKAREYLISLGANPASISISINTVDTAYFSSRIRQLREGAAGMTKEDSKKHLLYVGDLTPGKNIKKLLKTLKVLSASRTDVVLDIVGAGPQRSSLESYVRENMLEAYVKFHGFQQKDRLTHFYAAADCFVFQSDRDVWGLVLNEAMSAGIPSIASIHAGATHDLIEEGVTGFAMDFADSQAAAERIGWLLDHPDRAKQIGHNARTFIEHNATLEVSAAGFIRALKLR